MSIIVFKDIVLANNLRSGNVTQKQELFYLLFNIACVIFLSIAADSSCSDNRTLNIYDTMNYVALTITAIVITLSCYIINSIGTNTDFIRRYICLSLPINVKSFLLTAPFIFAALSYEYWLFMHDANVPLTALESLYTEGKITDEAYTKQYNEIYETYYVTTIYSTLASALWYIYYGWRYIRCFQHINFTEEID